VAVSDTLINTLFDGRYRIIRKLGAGGMANVYLAEDQELGRRVAIKILNDRHANDDQFVERFRREAKNAAGLSHTTAARPRAPTTSRWSTSTATPSRS
jgi:serine/threonine protein kinase